MPKDHQREDPPRESRRVVSRKGRVRTRISEDAALQDAPSAEEPQRERIVVKTSGADRPRQRVVIRDEPQLEVGQVAGDPEIEEHLEPAAEPPELRVSKSSARTPRFAKSVSDAETEDSPTPFAEIVPVDLQTEFHQAGEEARKKEEKAASFAFLGTFGVHVLFFIALAFLLSLLRKPVQLPPEIRAVLAPTPDVEQLAEERATDRMPSGGGAPPTVGAPISPSGAAMIPQMPRIPSANFGVGDVQTTTAITSGIAGEGLRFSAGTGTGSGGGSGDGRGIVTSMNITAKNLGVVLDVSGSMDPFLDGLRGDIHDRFPNARIMEVNGCDLRDQSEPPGVVPQFTDVLVAFAHLTEVDKCDGVFWFSDLADWQDDHGVAEARRLFVGGKIPLYVATVGCRPNSFLERVTRDSGGGVSVRAPNGARRAGILDRWDEWEQDWVDLRPDLPLRALKIGGPGEERIIHARHVGILSHVSRNTLGWDPKFGARLQAYFERAGARVTVRGAEPDAPMRPPRSPQDRGLGASLLNLVDQPRLHFEATDLADRVDLLYWIVSAETRSLDDDGYEFVTNALANGRPSPIIVVHSIDGLVDPRLEEIAIVSGGGVFEHAPDEANMR